jgi:hypothetical protein
MQLSANCPQLNALKPQDRQLLPLHNEPSLIRQEVGRVFTNVSSVEPCFVNKIISEGLQMHSGL